MARQRERRSVVGACIGAHHAVRGAGAQPERPAERLAGLVPLLPRALDRRRAGRGLGPAVPPRPGQPPPVHLRRPHRQLLLRSLRCLVTAVGPDLERHRAAPRAARRVHAQRGGRRRAGARHLRRRRHPRAEPLVPRGRLRRRHVLVPAGRLLLRRRRGRRHGRQPGRAPVRQPRRSMGLGHAPWLGSRRRPAERLALPGCVLHRLPRPRGERRGHRDALGPHHPRPRAWPRGDVRSTARQRRLGGAGRAGGPHRRREREVRRGALAGGHRASALHRTSLQHARAGHRDGGKPTSSAVPAARRPLRRRRSRERRLAPGRQRLLRHQLRPPAGPGRLRSQRCPSRLGPGRWPHAAPAGACERPGVEGPRGVPPRPGLRVPARRLFRHDGARGPRWVHTLRGDGAGRPRGGA